MMLLKSLLGPLNLVVDVEVVALLVPAGIQGGVNMLGPDGRSYALHYRVKKLVGPVTVKPVMLVD